MDLRHLEYFIAVAEERSFSAAAKRLRMAQPPLSIQIRSLEEELGARLFERLSRGVSLTPVGRIFLADARNVLERVEQSRSNFKMAVSGFVGRLSIGVLPTIVDEQIARFLREFRVRYPRVELDIHEIHSLDQPPALLENRIDLGFTRSPVNQPELEFRPISEEPTILAVPSNDPLARMRRVDWKHLDGRTLVMLDTPYATNFNTQFMACCENANISLRIGQYAKSVHMKMWLVSAGFGIAPTTHSLRYIARPNLSFCDLPGDAPMLKTMMAWRRSNDSPTLHNMLEIVGEAFKGNR